MVAFQPRHFDLKAHAPSSQETSMLNGHTPHLVKHVLEVWLGVHPRGDGITEEDKVLNHSCRVHADHEAHAAKGRVLLLVVANVAQRCAPTAPTSKVMVSQGRSLVANTC